MTQPPQPPNEPPQGGFGPPQDPPPGCPFHPRCPVAIDRCRTEVPPEREITPGRFVACHRADDVVAASGSGDLPVTHHA